MREIKKRGIRPPTGCKSRITGAKSIANLALQYCTTVTNTNYQVICSSKCTINYTTAVDEVNKLCFNYFRLDTFTNTQCTFFAGAKNAGLTLFC